MSIFQHYIIKTSKEKALQTEVLNFWYSGGDFTPLYNRPCMNIGYAIFAVNGYAVHTQLPLAAWYSRRESNPQLPLRSYTLIQKSYKKR